MVYRSGSAPAENITPSEPLLKIYSSFGFGSLLLLLLQLRLVLWFILVILFWFYFALMHVSFMTIPALKRKLAFYLFTQIFGLIPQGIQVVAAKLFCRSLKLSDYLSYLSGCNRTKRACQSSLAEDKGNLLTPENLSDLIPKWQSEIFSL